jgi:hypothetical protein
MTTDNETPRPGRARGAGKAFDATKFSRLAAAVKGGIVALAVRRILPARVATWLINVLGLREA